MESYKFVGPNFSDIKSWVAMEYLADTPSGNPLHNLFGKIGAVWNAQTGFWEINELTNVTNEQMDDIYYYTTSNKTAEARAFANLPCRTVTFITNQMNAGNKSFNMEMYFARSVVETLRLTALIEGLSVVIGMRIDNLSLCFEYCSRLRKVIGRLVLEKSCNTDNAFVNCTRLEEIKIRNLSRGISFSDCRLLNTDSIAYMINNASTEPVTITLHAEAYARAIADTGVQAALAAKPNVSLASV